MKNKNYNYRTSKQISRKFLGVWLPKSIYINDNLSWTEKILLTEIGSLQGERGCYASNEYLAKFLKLSEGTIRNIISKLKKDNYLIDRSNRKNKRSLFVNFEDNLDELKLNDKKLYETIKLSQYISCRDMKSNTEIDYSNINEANKIEKHKYIINNSKEIGYQINSIESSFNIKKEKDVELDDEINEEETNDLSV